MAPPPRVLSDADLSKAVNIIIACYNEKQQRGSSTAKKPRVIVAVAGRPGGGKSTVVQVIAAALREKLQQQRNLDGTPAAGSTHDSGLVEVAVMPMDGYHLYRKELQAMPNAAEAVRRRGAEWTFNPAKMSRDLTAICSANESGCYDDVRVPSFDHGVGDPKEEDITISGKAGIVIVEGNYVLYRGTTDWAAVNDHFDIKIYLQCDRAICTERLCRRHMKAWRISRAEAMVRATGSDCVNGDLTDTTAANADLVIQSREIETSKL